MGQWIIHYVFPDARDDKGATLCKVVQVRARDEEQARQFAHEIAPSEEFIFSLHPASDAQILGTVRHQALKMSGKARNGDFVEELADAEQQDAPAIVNWNVETAPPSTQLTSRNTAPTHENDGTIQKRRAIIERLRELSKKP
ncbi:hypothetical protein [Varunaivibrio sulfuroxidans]|uniref:Uncharacterized protein n=1 Tax=Varunaivibrio sulfuroxidans TaxID=1773489 RepID=A0A4R3JEA0_9PROT|nr:hypothetical protein [Varunaivibrio sulfuroxidans]TCS64388.1 hypothetical protein EDD55_102434 [Varunaivibrio sulfuroxidans]WES31181.1 hypothetical protein P3M64_02035 [Varunaivibrio sulfuroxidans]